MSARHRVHVPAEQARRRVGDGGGRGARGLGVGHGGGGAGRLLEHLLHELDDGQALGRGVLVAQAAHAVRGDDQLQAAQRVNKTQKQIIFPILMLPLTGVSLAFNSTREMVFEII